MAQPVIREFSYTVFFFIENCVPLNFVDIRYGFDFFL